MFREYAFDVKNAIKSGRNELRLKFSSPTDYAHSRAEDFIKNYNYSVPPECAPPLQQPACNRNFIRKMQASFSWDWGPAFPTMGIWKSVNLHTFQTPAFLHSISPYPNTVNEKWTVQVRSKVWCGGGVEEVAGKIRKAGQISYQIMNVPGRWTIDIECAVHDSWMTFIHRLPIGDTSNIKLWWPIGYGQQPLYKIIAQYSSSNNSDGIGNRKEVEFGFRTVELVQDRIDSSTETKGRTFYFKVNNVPIFLKGTNWIPADSFLSRFTEDRLQFLMRSMVASNMNALRVWGGGVYESDLFYSLADKYGMLIWQDFMFAVALYPPNPSFLDNVAGEVVDAVNRLGHHPSILVWAGNNENELGLIGGWYHSRQPAPLIQYKRDYVRLYNDTVWAAVNATDGDKGRPFLLSSPSNGIDTIRQGGIARNAGSDLFGDVHYYNYYGNAWEPSTFPISRCATEYGYQSLPEYSTLKREVTDGLELGYFGGPLMHRQHHPFGNLEMLMAVLIHFPLPRCNQSVEHNRVSLSKAQNFSGLCEDPAAVSASNGSALTETLFLKDMIYLTQIHQALAYKTETEHYRRWRNRTALNGMGNTMCALYWQLNELVEIGIWAAPTWASIDYYGNWKMAHYFAKQFFRPLMTSSFIENGKLQIGVVSDLMEPIGNDTMVGLEVYSWMDGLNPILNRTFPLSVAVPPLTSIMLPPIPIRNIANLISNRPTFDIDVNSLVVRTWLESPSSSSINSKNAINPKETENILLPDSFKTAVGTEGLGQVEIRSVSLSGRREFTIELEIVFGGPAPFVWLYFDDEGTAGNMTVRSPRGFFDDNGFTMLHRRHLVTWYGWGTKDDERVVDLAMLTSIIRVKSLRDLYQQRQQESTNLQNM